MGKLDKLQPVAVWKIFEKMSEIPRGSGNEAGVMNMFKAWSDERGLTWKQDEVGNMLVTIPGTPGLEHRIGGLEKQHETGNVSYDADNHQRMCTLRRDKVERIAEFAPPLEVFGAEQGVRQSVQKDVPVAVAGDIGR